MMADRHLAEPERFPENGAPTARWAPAPSYLKVTSLRLTLQLASFQPSPR
ncbi:hypothetical protein J2S42_007251 [Catenuloplanes indicus]|uniref:Uncharacterized protein n=1 Tax=Catenuloplanes indicus TaxID=137267 RepID=A0AAE3W8Q3_9ACTN|nr:hypothetical protein [Catenuloplanes indicus]